MASNIISNVTILCFIRMLFQCAFEELRQFLHRRIDGSGFVVKVFFHYIIFYAVQRTVAGLSSEHEPIITSCPNSINLLAIAWATLPIPNTSIVIFLSFFENQRKIPIRCSHSSTPRALPGMSIPSSSSCGSWMFSGSISSGSTRGTCTELGVHLYIFCIASFR